MSDLRIIIEATITGQVADLLHYDRKEDEDLPRGAIEQAIADGVITVDHMIDVYGRELRRVLRQLMVAPTTPPLPQEAESERPDPKDGRERWY